jgi:hypothetical protein
MAPLPTGSAVTATAPSPSSGCADVYTNSLLTVNGVGSNDFPLMPQPSTFVTRSGATLMLDGKEYRMVGPSEFPVSPLRDS